MRRNRCWSARYNLKKSSSTADRLGLATNAFNLATIYRMRGEFKRAEPYFHEAITIRQQTLGPDAGPVTEPLDGLGECLYDEGRDAEAESILRTSLTIARKQKIDLGDNSRDYLALVLERRGAYQEARQLLREAVEISRRFKGTESGSYFVHLHNLAGASIDAGDLTEAETTERQALAVRRRIVAADHPDLGYPLNNLGWILLARGDWKDAEPVLHEALEIRRKALGEKHPLFAASLANWARVLGARRLRAGRTGFSSGSRNRAAGERAGQLDCCQDSQLPRGAATRSRGFSRCGTMRARRS